MSHPRIILDLIDADGCVYNNTYRNMLLWLAIKHGDTLVALNEARITEKKLNIKNPDIDQKIQQIKEDLTSCHLTALTPSDYDEMNNELTKKARINFDKQREQARIKLDALGMTGDEAYIKRQLDSHFSPLTTDAQLYQSQIRYYLDIMQALDASLLSSVFMHANEPLIQRLSNHGDDHQKQFIAIGSNRQAHGFDQLGMKRNMTGSIFQDIFFLTRQLRTALKEKNIHVTLNPLTMADIDASLPSGESFQRIVMNKTGKHATYLCDVSKLTLLYAMTQDAAKKHPEAEIVVNFYENEENIINGLKDTFSRYPELLPSNVTLVLHHYDGKLGNQVILKGNGPLDEDYRENVRYMASLTHLNPHRANDEFIDAVHELDIPVFLENRNFKSDDKTLAVLLDADGCIYNRSYTTLVMKLIKKYGVAIRECARNKLDYEGRELFRDQLLQDITTEDVSAFNGHQYSILSAYINLHPDIQTEDSDIPQDGLPDPAAPFACIMRQYIRYLQEIDPALIDAILYQANQALFTRITERAKREDCSRVALFVGSNRQAVNVDDYNSKINGTGSFYYDLQRLTAHLNERLRGSVAYVLDRFLLADAYGGVPAGESFHRALRNSGNSPHTASVFDDTKASLVYGHLHHIARYYPGTFAVEFYDDRRDIFESLLSAFGQHDTHGLLPQGLPLELIPYNGSFSALEATLMIEGSGAADESAHRSIRLMANMCGIDLKEAQRKSSRVNIAEALDFNAFAAKREAQRAPLQVEFDSLIDSGHNFLNPRRNIGLFDLASVTRSQPAVVQSPAMKLN